MSQFSSNEIMLMIIAAYCLGALMGWLSKP
jgi:hypothetical protein